jgi:hypothetical protein
MFIPDSDLIFYPSLIPDPGVKRSLDPGSGTLIYLYLIYLPVNNFPEYDPWIGGGLPDPVL